MGKVLTFATEIKTTTTMTISYYKLDIYVPNSLREGELVRFLRENYNLHYGYGEKRFLTHDKLLEFVKEMCEKASKFFGTNLTLKQANDAIREGFAYYSFYISPNVSLNIQLRSEFHLFEIIE